MPTRKGLKVDVNKRTVILLGGDEVLICEFLVDGRLSEHISKFKYLRCTLVQMVANIVGKVEDATRSLVNAGSLQLKYTRVLHETMLVLVLLYGSETTVGRDKGRIMLELCKLTTLEVYWALVE